MPAWLRIKSHRQVRLLARTSAADMQEVGCPEPAAVVDIMERMLSRFAFSLIASMVEADGPVAVLKRILPQRFNTKFYLFQAGHTRWGSIARNSLKEIVRQFSTFSQSPFESSRPHHVDREWQAWCRSPLPFVRVQIAQCGTLLVTMWYSPT